MYGTKRWSIDFAGVLANDGEVSTGRNAIIVNRNDNLQFYIRLTSTPPENFPRQVKDVCGYADDLNDWGFYDDNSLTLAERIEALRNFLNRYVLFFHVELRKRSGTQEYHIAKNIHIVKKSDSFRPDTILEPIPIFSELTTERTKDVFEQQLFNQKYVGDNKQISKDEDDTPSMILWENSRENLDYTLYGFFNKHEIAYAGFKFYPLLENIYSLPLEMEYVMESYLHNNLLFVDSRHLLGMQDILEEKCGEQGKNTPEEDHNNTGEHTANKEKVELHLSYGPTATTEYKSVNEQPKPTYKEKGFMEFFESECKRMGLYYETKDLYNFHTAMKTGGLIVLAGMSGTGKSKLVQCYAHALKLNKDQIAFIPVRPFWQDDSDVIGYLDTLHNVYRPGDSGLMNILTRANDYPEDLHIVCFDEMNLARVEHYFSQFLSILELEENKRLLDLYNDEYSARIYNQNIFPSTLRIGSNVIFVGTVNLDETTYPFSDKVLDRANVITLTMKSYADILRMEEERTQGTTAVINTKDNPITFDVYSSFKKKERKIILTSQESTLLWKLDTALKRCNRHLGVGWRILRQISSFLNNLPVDSPFDREEAFDIQIVQRIMTKVRGSEEQFMELIGQYNLDTKEVENSEFFKLLSDMPSSYKFEKTREIIKEKAKELRLHGHTI
ncbi:AAA family ATPase [Priestia megaterium]